MIDHGKTAPNFLELRLGHKPNATRTNPLESIVEATLTIIKRKPIWPYPPNGGPSFGISLHGPILRNFAIPKAAVNTEDENVSRNMVLLLS